MSDEPKALNAGGAPPRRPGLPGAAGGPRPPRPAMQPPAPSAASMRLRKHLMLGILISCLVLGGMIAWRIYKVMNPAVRTAIDVDEEFGKQVDLAKDASKAIFALQTKVWGKDAELTPEDFATIKTRLAELRDCHDKLKDLLDLLHARKLDDSGTKHAIVPKWLQLKMWILDAADLLDNPKPPEYGGLNIPMFVTSEKIRKGQVALSEINTTKDEVIKRNDPEEIKAVRKKIHDLRDGFRAHATKLQALDQYVQDGLARPDLTDKEVMELGHLRDEANKAGMAVRAAGELLKAFPE